ncbi:MAG: two-component sensor histidine kinase [Rhodospirillales bacterium]|nr:two-component sensor histidine kinase [Rhodospirillales bacterium]
MAAIMADDPDRPQPEALLSELKKASRGRLKIFLGAAPGVGKTYAMLEATQRRRKEGTNLVVGILETHGRAETELLLDGLDVLPRKQIVYRDRIFYEMDIDGILKRRPRLVIVDELAHTNVPGSRHVKRYQDVAEILDAGIDVYTTLNIQHLESLNDIIARIARVRVRETVPDSVLDQADEIELIDLPPEDLIERLHQGKVYVKDQASRAITHFFSRGNLTALRELTMRAAAERVDAEMLTYMKAHAISGPWPTRERIMVCVNESAVGPKLVRGAQRSADRLRSSWIAVHVQTPNEEHLKEEAKDRIQDTLALAERLGAEVVVLPGAMDAATELLNYARSRNVSRLLVGQPRKRRFGRWVGRSVTQRLIEGAKSFEVLVIGAEDEKSAPEQREQPAVRTFDENSPREYALSIGAVVAAGLVAAVAEYFIPLQSLSIVFVLPVLISALRFGLWPSVVASLLSFVVYRYFFTEPRFALAITTTEDFFTLVFFFVVAMLTGRVAARSREQAEASRQAARRTAKLYDFSRRIAAAASRDDVLWAVVHHVAATLQCRSLVLLPGPDGGLDIAAGYPPEDHLTDAAIAASDWAWRHGKPAGWKSDTLPSSEWLFMPLRTATGPVGLLGVAFDESETMLIPEQRRLLDAVSDQAAVAIERTNLASSIEDARVMTETEQLRSALLSSISHDLRTPLVSIIGSATSLVTFGDTLSPENRGELLETVLEEAERLNRFVQNLLDMTRLGYGALKPKQDWVDLHDVVGSAIERLKQALAPYNVVTDVKPDMHLLYVDPILIEQVMVNVLDNAAKYSTAGDTIHIRAFEREGVAVIQVVDKGPGIPERERELIFDMFYRVKAGDNRIAGTGLGLAICRGLMQAQGGTIQALPGDYGEGTCIELTLPIAEPPEPEAVDDGLEEYV